jgi:hypothetical protein
MFERIIENPAENAVRRLVGLFRVATVGLIANGVLAGASMGLGNPLVAGVYIGFTVLCAIGTWVTADGVENRKRWARNTGFIIAVLSLFSLGIGTIFGLIELYSLWRAQRGGQFSASGDAP